MKGRHERGDRRGKEEKDGKTERDEMRERIKKEGEDVEAYS